MKNKNKLISLLLSFMYLCTALFLVFPSAVLGEKANLNRAYDDRSISSLAPANGLLYFLKPGGLYALTPGEETYTLVSNAITPDDWRNGAFNSLYSDNDTLYLFSSRDYTLQEIVQKEGTYTLAPMEKATAFLQSQVKEEEVEGYYDPSGFQGIFDGKIFLYQREENKETLITYHLTTEEETLTTVQNTTLAIPYPPTGFAAIEEKRVDGILQKNLIAIAPTTGETTLLTSLNPQIAYEELIFSNNQLYVIQNTLLSTFNPNTNGLETVAPLLESSFYHLTFITPTLVAHIAGDEDTMLVVKSIDANSLLTRPPLVVVDNIGKSGTYKAFMQRFPQGDLTIVRDLPISEEERFVQDMLIKDDKVDVYVLTDPNSLSIIKSKGFGADMAQNTEIAQIAQTFTQSFQNAFMEDGKVLAFPQEVFLETPTYHPNFFAESKLPIPTTYEDLLQFYLNWYQTNHNLYGEKWVLFLPYGLTLPNLLSAYWDEMAYNQGSPSFTSPQMVTLVTRFLEVLKAQEAYQEALPQDYWNSHQNIIVSYFPLSNDQYHFMPLAFQKDQQWVVGTAFMNMRYFVVNPYSKNQTMACNFALSYQDMRMPDGNGLLFSTTTPIAYPIDKSTENYERDTLAELQKALAKAEEKDQTALKEEMAYYQEAVAFYDNQPPYVIDTPALEDYQQNLAPYLFISPFNPISQLYEEYPELFTKVEEGEITPQIFLQELEQKVDMMVKEFD